MSSWRSGAFPSENNRGYRRRGSHGARVRFYGFGQFGLFSFSPIVTGKHV
jgi:hypothetical protein